jgi:hypothetical protein
MHLKTKSGWVMGVLSAILFLTVERLPTQTAGNSGGNRGRGGGDPAQFLERRMERYRDQLEVTNAEEWKVIQPRIEKVMQAQRLVRVGGYSGPRRGPPSSGGQPAETPNGGGARGNRGSRYTPESNPDAVALQKTVDSKASSAEIKAQLARLRETLKQKEADLNRAQEELRQLLTVRQEAIAVLLGLLR